MKLLHHNIKKIEDLKPFVSDARLDKAIGCLIEDHDQTSIAGWKRENADELMSLSTVSVRQFMDAMAGFYSGDPDAEEALKQWAANYIAFKNAFKKEKSTKC